MEGIWKARRHSALRFDGVDDWVRINNDSSLDPYDHGFTIYISFLIDPTNEHFRILDKFHYTYGQGYSLRQYSGQNMKLLVSDGSNTVYCDSSIKVNDGVEHTVCVGIGDGSVWFFVDGVQVGEECDMSSLSAIYSDMFLEFPHSSMPCSGLFSSLRIYSRKLSLSEAKYLYYNPDDPLDTDHLVLWLHPGSIDTDAGVWYDLSQYGNDGTIYGATKVSLVSPEVTVL